MKIEFREAVKTDVPLIQELTSFTFREAWLEEGNENDLQTYMDENFNLDQINSEIENPDITYLLVEVDREPAGYCKLHHNQQPEGFHLINTICISRFYIQKKYQNLKLGSEMMNLVIRRAEKEKFNSLWLGVWFKNIHAIRFYERFGFRKFGMYKFVMGNEISDDHLMKRDLR